MIDKKAAIFEAARELFLLKGFKDVNVSDITQNAGVGVGTFYIYYPSKEKLFLEIFIKENQNAKKSIIDSLDMDQAPVPLMKAYLLRSMDAMRNNLILKEWYQSDISKQLEAYHQENPEVKGCMLRDLFVQLVKKWKAEKAIREDIDDELILSVFDSLVFLDNHQEDVGVKNFSQVIRLLSEFFIKGLTEQ